MDLLTSYMGVYYETVLNELRLMNKTTISPNITYNSLLYLELIAYKEDCTVSYLAERLHVTKSAVTLKVNELIGAGLVQKTQSKADKRVYYLTLTDIAKNDYRNYDKPLQQAMERIKNKYSSTEIATVISVLNEIREEYVKTNETEN